MNEDKQPKHRKRAAALLVLLAVVCIGGVELAACRHFDPALYQQITAPVRAGAAAVAGFCQQTAGQFSRFWEDLAAQAAARRAAREAEQVAGLESQLASDPSIISEIPISDPSITDLREGEGYAYLTGGLFNVDYFNQGDEAWADEPYGSDPISGYGCGPTAMAIVISTLTEEETDPAVMAQWAADHGYWARKSGSYLSIVEGAARAHGLQAESFSERTPEALRESLLAGNLLVALMGPGHFTQRGHFIVLRGVTLSGEILIADPNSTDRSLTAWDAQLLFDELSASTSNGAPLWVISRGEDG